MNFFYEKKGNQRFLDNIKVKGGFGRMKIVRQRDLKDCGICSLASIIEYYGGYVSLERLRIDAKVSIEGTTALNLIEASKKYGFDATGVKVSNLKDANIKLPAIAHLQQKNGINHYVVIYKITETKVILMDPARGKVIKTKDEFYEEWSHILLMFYPRRKITIFEKTNTLLSIFQKIFIHEKKLFLLILITSIFLMIFTIIGSYYFQIMIDGISQNYYVNYLKIFVVVFGIMVIFKLIFTYLRNYFENHLNKNIDCLLNSNFLTHIFNLPLEVITSRSSGEIMTRVNELANIKNLFTEIFVTCLLDFLLAIAAVPLLYKISSKLFLALFLCLLLYLLVGIIASKIIYKKAYHNIELEADFNNTLLENINLINSIKNLHITKSRLENIENSLSDLLMDNYQVSKFINNEELLKNIINEIGFFVINTWGFYLIFKGSLEITSLVTFNTLLAFFLEPIKNCIDSLPKYNFLKATFTKINDFLSLSPECEGDLSNLTNNCIVIKNLTYSYDALRNIFTNFSLKIPGGSFVSLKGKSGCGKSTLCQILDKYIADYQGEILIGKRNIKDLSITTIRKNITYVSQNEALITGSIKENILLGRKVSDEKFYEICKLCLVDEIVAKKALRYEAIISNDSNNISGGEMQRVILARALLNDFSILMLDEALSEVDYYKEKRIIQNLKRKYKDKTIIYITHKNHDKLFDRVIKLEDSYEL